MNRISHKASDIIGRALLHAPELQHMTVRERSKILKAIRTEAAKQNMTLVVRREPRS